MSDNMKLIIEIPSEHTAEILTLLAKLMKPTTVEAQPDPAELPFPKKFPKLPSLPEGKTRWVYRGTFPEIDTDAAHEMPDRVIRYYQPAIRTWLVTKSFSTSYHHIEAVKGGSHE